MTRKGFGRAKAGVRPKAARGGRSFGTGSGLRRLNTGQKARVTARRVGRAVKAGAGKVRRLAGTKGFRRGALLAGGALAGGAAVYAYNRRQRNP